MFIFLFLSYVSFHLHFLQSKSLQKIHTSTGRTVMCICSKNTYIRITAHFLFMKHVCAHTVLTHYVFTIQTHTSSSSLPSFSPHCSAGEPALTWLTKIPVRFPPTIVISSARLALLCFGEVGGLEDGELEGMLRDGKDGQQ